jgi:hypothetical protein
VLFFGLSSVNGDIPNPGSQSKLMYFWEQLWFENGNNTENKVRTVTGKNPRTLVEHLQIHPVHPFFLFDRASGFLRNYNICCIFTLNN